MINGNRVSVSCQDLGLPEHLWTKEGSRKAAYAFKLKLIGQFEAEQKLRHAHADYLDKLTERLQVATDLGLDTTSIKNEIEETKALRADQNAYVDKYTAAKIIAAELAFGIDLTGADPVALNTIFGSDDLWNDRKRRSRTVEIGKTIGDAAKRFIEGKQDEARNKIRSADGADNIRRWLNRFIDFVGRQCAIDSITFDLWERWQRTCRAKSRDTQTAAAKDEYQTSKSFVRWLWKQDLLQLPKNFSDNMRFPQWTPEIETYSTSEISETVKLASGQLKLHILLMINCGMTQRDISELKHEQIDWKTGVITRKRSKTELSKKTPLVSYKLWKDTLRELKKHLSKDPVLALTTKSGKPWCRKEIKQDGRLYKADNIATLWRNLRKRNPDAVFLKSLKAVKKTSASLLRNNTEFSEFHDFFLGHSEKTTAGRNYAKLDQNKFANAVIWLGRQYGLK